MNNQQIRNAWLTSIGIWYKKNPNLLCEFIFKDNSKEKMTIYEFYINYTPKEMENLIRIKEVK